jgi:hypothetical protein
MVYVARRHLVLGLAFGVELATSTAAGATVDACIAPKVNVSVPPGAQWQTATEDLTEHLRALKDLDKCARVFVRPGGLGVVVEITTSDGRRATRQVESEAELLRTIEALLILPPASAAAPVQPSPLESPPREPQPARTPNGTTHVELGVGGSLRFGGGPLYAGGGVAGFAQFGLDDWLLAVSGRWDVADAFVSEVTPTDFSMQSSAVGVSVGHRVELSNANLDALIGPSIVLEGQDADDGDRELHGAAADFRLAFALRVSGPRASSLRAFATGDFEGSPARVRAQKFISHSLPQLPWWSGGVAIGVLWGGR